ncbi:MAG: hypothetical protein XD92_1409, partial [Proteiniphilum acetatigenes]
MKRAIKSFYQHYPVIGRVQLTALSLSLAFLLSSCIDEELNIDPNRPSAVQTPSLIVTAEKHLLDNIRSESASLRSSALFIQQLSQVTYTSQSRYDIPFSYSDNVWDGLYEVANNLQEVIVLNSDPATKDLVTADGAGRNASQIAISRILKSVAFSALTDIFGDPSRNAARGGLGAVMGSKGLKAIILDPTGTDQVPIADPEAFRKTVREWAEILKHDVSISLYSRFGTPFAINNSAGHGTLPAMNYRSGRPDNFTAVSGNNIQKILFERGGKMHGCMPGCLVQCSIIYPDKDGKKICAAYEYE